MFQNREEAAKELAQKLLPYRGSKDTVIIALPRGGVPLAAILAKELHLPFDIFFVKKIPSPYNKEAGIGAVSENGYYFVNKAALESLRIPQEYIEKEIAAIQEKMAQKRALYKKSRNPIKGKRVILIDDGIATGSSMLLAAQALQKEGAKEIIIAAPVIPFDTLDSLQAVANSVVALQTPKNFMAVGAFYKDFHQLSDDEVIELLKESL